MSAYLDLLMFAAACLVLLAGFPVAFTLAGVAIAFGLIGQMFGVFDMAFFYALPQRIYGNMTNEVLIAVPLFVFMGTMLERARVARNAAVRVSARRADRQMVSVARDRDRVPKLVAGGVARLCD